MMEVLTEILNAATAATAANRDAAEAAAANAVGAIGGAIYSDYSAGLAAVADGNLFRIKMADGLAILTYQRSGDVADLVAIAPVDGLTAATARALTQSGAIGPALPMGAVADLVTVDTLYSLSVGPNRVESPRSVLSNVLGASRPSNTYIRSRLVNASLTLTWDVVGEDDAPAALRIEYSGVGASSATLPIRVPPGQWTLSMRAKSNSGSNGEFRVAIGSTLASLTATPSWSTLSATIARTTDATAITLFQSPVAQAAVDVTIDSICLTPGEAAGILTPDGASFQRPTLPQREALIVKNTRSPTNAGAVYRLTLNGQQSLSEWTLSLIVRRSAADLTPEINALFAFDGGGTYSISYPHGTSFVPKLSAVPMIGLPARKWVVLTYVFRATGEGALWVNGCKMAVSSLNASATVARYVELLKFSSDSDALLGGLGGATFYQRALGDDEVVTLFAAQKSRAAVVGGGFSDYSCVYLAEGDSITAGRNASPTNAGYAYLIGREFDPFLSGLNFGVDGSTLTTLESSARYNAAIAAIQRGVAAGKTVLMSVLIGTNDASSIATTTAADAWYARLVAYWSAMRLAGARIIAATCLPRNDGAWNETVRAHLNGLIRGDPTKYDALVDYAADAALGTWSEAYWGDNLHPSTAGHVAMKNLLKAQIDTL